MAYNKTLALAEDDEKKKALADAVAAQREKGIQIRARDAEAMRGVLTPSANQQTQLNQMASELEHPADEENKRQFVMNQLTEQGASQEEALQRWDEMNRPVAGARTNTKGATPDAFEEAVWNQADEPAEALDGDSALPPVDEPNPLRKSLDNMKLNRNVGPKPAVNGEYQLPEGYLETTSYLESGGNPNARSKVSSATGEYQIIEDTARRLGIDPTDPEQNKRGAEMLARQHRDAYVKRYGREPTGSELYAMHQQGQPKGFKMFDANPSEKAVDVLGNKEVLNNGGNSNMTVGEFRTFLDNKYNKASVVGQSSNPEELYTPPTDTTDIVKSELPQDGGASAVEGKYDDATRTFMANPDNIEYDANGFGEIDAGAMGLNFKTDFQHRNREVSDSGALWQGALAGAIAVLGTALMGGDSRDMGTAFFLAGADRFGTSLNESHRYKNLEALTKMGYTPDSIEAYIESGDRSQLKKHEIEPWQDYGDGSGRKYRQLPNGKIQVMKGKPTYTAVVSVEGGKKVQRFFNPTYGFQKDANNNDIVLNMDDGSMDLAKHERSLALKNATSSTDKNAAKAAQKVVDGSRVANNMMTERMARLRNSIQYFKDDGGNYVHDLKSDKKVSKLANSINWALLGGGLGKFPENIDKLTSLDGGEDVRDRIVEAQRIGATLQNQAVEAARASGASGINTMAEINNFAKMEYSIDYSSYSNMVRSIERIEREVDAFEQRFRAALERDEDDARNTLGLPAITREQQETTNTSSDKNPAKGSRYTRGVEPGKSQLTEEQRKLIEGL